MDITILEYVKTLEHDYQVLEYGKINGLSGPALEELLSIWEDKDIKPTPLDKENTIESNE